MTALASPEDLAAAIPVVRKAATEAARLVLTGFRQRLVVEHKGAIDLVTKFDRESEGLLRERLGDAFGVPIVGEEAGGQAPASGPVFYVDPLDGTTNFVHGHPFWCVSIGLVVDGAPVLGFVLSPPLGLEWSGWIAASGERSATRRAATNGILDDETHETHETRETMSKTTESPCSVSSHANLADAMLATGFPYDRRTSPENNFAEFTGIKRRCQAVRRCGSAAMDLCLVADGTYDGYWEQKLSPWDIAGGIALVRAAGGRVTDYDGAPPDLGRGKVVATNGPLHDALLTELTAARSG
jgi:myo-inositol-1(or 4)-monophosphatase